MRLRFQPPMPILRAFACCAITALLPQAAFAADPLKSPACGSSLAALEQARRNDDAARIEPLRERATRDCLGGAGDARRPAPVARAPVVVPPPVIEADPAQPIPARPPDPAPVARPPVVTSCDLGGCWDSNGTRLNRSGPVLLGPGGGVCATAGSTVHCP